MLKNYVRIYSGECILEKHAPVSITRTQEMIDYMLKKKNYVLFIRISSKDRRAHHHNVLSD